MEIITIKKFNKAEEEEIKTALNNPILLEYLQAIGQQTTLDIGFAIVDSANPHAYIAGVMEMKGRLQLVSQLLDLASTQPSK